MPNFKNSEEYEKWKADRLKNPSKSVAPKQPPQPDKKKEKRTRQSVKKYIVSGIIIFFFSIGCYYLFYMPYKNAQKELELKEHNAKIQHETEIRERERKQTERVRQLNEGEERRYLEREAETRREDLKTQQESERQKQEASKRAVLAKKNLDDCIYNAWAAYKELWNTKCKNIGMEEDCPLPTEDAESYHKEHQLSKDNCYKTYGNASK